MLFTVVLLVGVCLLFVRPGAAASASSATVLLAGLMLAAIPALGPGYGPQYAYWYVPPLLASYLLLDDGWRRILSRSMPSPL